MGAGMKEFLNLRIRSPPCFLRVLYAEEKRLLVVLSPRVCGNISPFVSTFYYMDDASYPIMRSSFDLSIVLRYAVAPVAHRVPLKLNLQP